MGRRKVEINLQLQVHSTWRSADRVQVYTDSGTGTVDADSPLLPVARPLFPFDPLDRVAEGGYGVSPYGVAGYGGGPVGCGQSGYGIAPYAEGPYAGSYEVAHVTVAVIPGYGDWIFAAQAIDGAGNEQGELQEFTKFLSGENPPPLSAFAYSSYDSGTDTLTFGVAV